MQRYFQNPNPAKSFITMHYIYTKWVDSVHSKDQKSPFDTLFDLFHELLSIAGGDVTQALHWLNQLDKEYKLTDQFDGCYGMGDFIEELENRGYIRQDDQAGLVTTSKTGRSIREKAREEIISNLRKRSVGENEPSHSGRGLENQPETSPWKAGDDMRQVNTPGTRLN